MSQTTSDDRRLQALRALGGLPPMPLTEAEVLIAQAADLDTTSLIADRAEAVAELAAARRTLGLPETPARRGDDRPTVARPEFDPTPLREAAQAVVETARRVEAVGASSEAVAPPDPGALAAADQAVAEADAAQDQLGPAWRRTVGALISGTGMAIVIAALSWPVWSYLVPIVLIAIVTADLRVAGSVAREASARAKQHLTALGVGGTEGLQRVRERAKDQEVVSRRTEEARRQHEEALARWSHLAPGEDPADVETVVARSMAETAAVADSSPAADEDRDDDLPPVADDPVLALALRLAREARDTITLVDDQLAVADRVEHARRSLEWYAVQDESGARGVPEGSSAG